VPVEVKTLAYDVRCAHSGVGAHVHDTAYYICWAFARVYSPEALQPHLAALCSGMLSAALFDREINVRRAAAAAAASGQ
jgi:tubulin-specific chaperone D